MEETRPYHVTVFTSPESRARRITTSQTPHTFEDAAELARKARLIARIRTVFIILLSLATAAYGLMLVLPRLNPYSQQVCRVCPHHFTRLRPFLCGRRLSGTNAPLLAPAGTILPEQAVIPAMSSWLVKPPLPQTAMHKARSFSIPTAKN